ncbi:MAG: hypothetical protein K2I09_06130, partial [Duncaniella sp.]|nr:hypothetical protein [Duncaniella sp.]
VMDIECPCVMPSLRWLMPLSTSCNDVGKASLYHDGDRWLVSLIPGPGQQPRIMTIDRDLRHACVNLQSDDPCAGFVIDSMARILFSQYAASRGSLMLHASVVECGDRAYLFMGTSGTGKSTHSRLWIDNFSGCTLLNDDCPLVTASGDEAFQACGTPWSGKTPCWRNASYEVGGIARISRAAVNRFIPTEGIEAFVSFIPGMSVMTSDRELYSDASSTALRLLGSVTTGILECRPDAEAATVCRRAFGITSLSDHPII